MGTEHSRWAASAIGRRARLVLITAIAAASVLASLGVAGADATTNIAPTISTFSQSASTVNVTHGGVTVTLTLHVIDPNENGVATAPAGTNPPMGIVVDDSFTPAAGAYTEQPFGTLDAFYQTEGGPSVQWGLSLASGTYANGTWTGTATLAPGWAGTYTTSYFNISDNLGLEQNSYTAAQVAAAGAQPITSTVAAAPAAPSKITSSIIAAGLGTAGEFKWTDSGAAPIATTVDSFSNCGSQPTINAWNEGELVVVSPLYAGLCTVNWHTYNSAGRSPEAKSTGFFIDL